MMIFSFNAKFNRISKKELNVVPDIVIVFAWNFYESIVESNKDLIAKGAKFLSIKELIG